MRRRSCILALCLACAGTLSGRPSVDICGVDFDRLESGWIQMKVSLACGRNRLPGARDDRFVDDIGVQVHLAYETGRDPDRFEFYGSGVEIVSMEAGTDANVYFFLPGVLLERDRLRPEPFFHLVELSVGERALPLDPDGVGRRFRDDAKAVASLRSKVRTEGAGNDGCLLPSYLAPLVRLGARVSGEPVYRRRGAARGPDRREAGGDG